MRRLAFIFPPAASYALIVNLCHLIFQCGCRSWWTGAADHCNIHNPSARHCPWCSHGSLGFQGVLAFIVIPQLLLAFFPMRLDWRIRLVCALVAFPVLGILAALGMGLADGYWSPDRLP